jgi:hypothetical protein
VNIVVLSKIVGYAFGFLRKFALLLLWITGLGCGLGFLWFQSQSAPIQIPTWYIFVLVIWILILAFSRFHDLIDNKHLVGFFSIGAFLVVLYLKQFIPHSLVPTPQYLFLLVSIASWTLLDLRSIVRYFAMRKK